MADMGRRRCLTVVAGAWAAGVVGARLGAAAAESDLVPIPAGPFRMGTSPERAAELARRYGVHPSWLAGECPERTVDLAAFRMERYPVTNRRYAGFCAATGYAPPLHWGGREPPADRFDHPVVFVNRADARAYARWAGRRLPTAAEWEKAARGTDGRQYPWGEEFAPDACHFDRGGPVPPAGPMPVTAHPGGASPYGVMDLAGNVAEWCEDGPGPGSAYVRGGAWVCASPLSLRCAACGLSGFDNNRLDFIGFRCAAEA